MASKDYIGKTAYRGEIAIKYDADRVTEAAWSIEQSYVDRWIQTLPRGSTLLDVPTGTGRFLQSCVSHGLAVTASDISEDMLTQLRLTHASIAQNVSLVGADAEHLPLHDGEVQYLLSWRFLHLLPLPVVKGVVREFSRVCSDSLLLHAFAVDLNPPSVLSRIRTRLRNAFAPARDLRAQKNSTPWQHITSYSHRETDLLLIFAENGLILERAETLEHNGRFATRVYHLTRRLNLRST